MGSSPRAALQEALMEAREASHEIRDNPINAAGTQPMNRVQSNSKPVDTYETGDTPVWEYM